VTRACHDVGLGYLMLVVELSYFHGDLEAIHNWHRQIREHKSISQTVFHEHRFYFFNSFCTRTAKVSDVLNDVSVQLEISRGQLENNLHSLQVKGLVVDNQDATVLGF
jgi:hypothetical protein